MIQQTIFSFKIETTKERLTAHVGAGINGGIQSWDWVKRAYGPVSTLPWEQSGFRPFSDCGQYQRGQAENFNKEVKNAIGRNRMPCAQSYANAVFFRIVVIAYNLFIGFKRLSCPESWMKQTIATFRRKMV